MNDYIDDTLVHIAFCVMAVLWVPKFHEEEMYVSEHTAGVAGWYHFIAIIWGIWEALHAKV
jgi:hypothetical protein